MNCAGFCVKPFFTEEEILKYDNEICYNEGIQKGKFVNGIHKYLSDLNIYDFFFIICLEIIKTML